MEVILGIVLVAGMAAIAILTFFALMGFLTWVSRLFDMNPTDDTDDLEYYDGKFTLTFIAKELQGLNNLNRVLTPFEVNYYDALMELQVERELDEEM